MSTSSDLSNLNQQLIGVFATGLSVVGPAPGPVIEAVSLATGGSGNTIPVAQDTPFQTVISPTYSAFNSPLPPVQEQKLLIQNSQGFVFEDIQAPNPAAPHANSESASVYVQLAPANSPDLAVLLKDEHSTGNNDVLTHDVLIANQSVLGDLSQTDLASLSIVALPVSIPAELSTLLPAALPTELTAGIYSLAAPLATALPPLGVLG